MNEFKPANHDQNIYAKRRSDTALTPGSLAAAYLRFPVRASISSFSSPVGQEWGLPVILRLDPRHLVLLLTVLTLHCVVLYSVTRCSRSSCNFTADNLNCLVET